MMPGVPNPIIANASRGHQVRQRRVARPLGSARKQSGDVGNLWKTENLIVGTWEMPTTVLAHTDGGSPPIGAVVVSAARRRLRRGKSS